MTFDEVRAVIEYNSETGNLIWRACPKRHLRRIGKVAGGKCPHGYIKVSVKGKRYYAHQVAWLLATGIWPKGQIDHINGDRADNRLSNLRDVSCVENQQNRDVHRAGKPLGVVRHKRSGRFYVFLPYKHPLCTRGTGYSQYHSSHKTLLEASVVSQLLILGAKGIL